VGVGYLVICLMGFCYHECLAMFHVDCLMSFCVSMDF